MLPTVDFCGLSVTRLVLGANPFGGYSHQTKERDEAMRSFHTQPRILETWARAEQAGINTFVTNNETPHVIAAVRAYLEGGGRLQWIAQVNTNVQTDMYQAMDGVIAMGCKALYIHGAKTDAAYAGRDEKTVRAWCDHARRQGVPVGVAGHAPEAHLWVNSLECADFHAVCFFNCGSLHDGKGSRFRLPDMGPAAEAVRRIAKPCIAYKILGAGRIDARMGFENAFRSIKPGDVVNVGMHRGDRDDMVEHNAALAAELLGA